MKGVIALILLLTFAVPALAQDKSNRGKEFWLGYGFHWIFTNPDGVVALNSQEMALYISTEKAATVTVSINGTTWSQTLNIAANTVDASILVPKSGANDARILSDGLSNRAIHIVSTEPVAVYAHVYVTQGSGATMLMPVETYGYSYYSVNYLQNTSASPLPALASNIANGPDWYSWFYVVASEDNTRIRITPADTTRNGWLPGQSYTVNLNKGEIYTVFGKMVPNNNNPWAASKDMTGSKVISLPGNDGSCHPFALFSGSSGIRICRGDGGEYMQQQMFPSQAWGTRYLTYHTINNTNTDINETNRNYYRVCVSDPATVVKRNGTPLTGLQKNFFYEFMDSTGGDYIEADKPVLVSQYMVNKNQCWNFPTTTPSPPSNGDPEMFYLSPIEQGQKSVRFFASRQSPAVSYVYANIVLPTAGTTSLRVDGSPVSAPQIRVHPNNAAYSVALVRFTSPAAQHTITSDSTFNATVYGLGNYESYGYNVGTLVNNLNYFSEISNTQKTTTVTDTFSCPKTPLRIFLKVGFPATNIQWKLNQVPGISPNTDSIINSPVPVRTESINGRTYYVYTLQQDFTFATPGIYTIPVTYGAAVIENCSQTENALVRVVIKPGPTADFSVAASGNGCIKDSVQLTGIVNAGGFNITQYLWNFPDGSTANTLVTAKKFTTTGTQNIRFRVYADNGCAADTSKIITLQPAAVAAFTMQSEVCAADSVLLTDQSTNSSGTITAWEWFYQANAITRNNNTPFKIAYNNAGNYTVQLVVTGSNGCKSDTATHTITIHPRPVASFVYSGNICAGDSIRFTDNSTLSSGTLTKWNWDFGNGQTLQHNSNAPFYWPFSTTGSYTASLFVTSAKGCVSDTARQAITVNNRPVAAISFTGLPCIDSSISFLSSVTASPATWHWDFGNGQTLTSSSTSSAQQVYHAIATNVTIKHVVSFGPGCTSDTATVVIPNIYANPAATIQLASDTLCENRTIAINGNTSSTGISWIWSVDGTNTTQAPPLLRTYTAGNHAVTAVVKNAGGCTSLTSTANFQVKPIPDINAGPDIVINPGSTVQLNATLTNASEYDIAWTPAATLSDPTLLRPSATPAVPTIYTVVVRNKTAYCSSSDQVYVNVVVKLNIPNAFSPNGDNVNDTWLIPGIELYPDAVVMIFNRYGQKLSEQRKYNQHAWDGTRNGQPLPVGSYYYVVQLNNDHKDVLTGTVILLR